MEAFSPLNTVLLVDDSWYIQLLVEELLTAEGYDVSCASTGIEAVDAYMRERPDVVLMDVVLPGIDGFDACSRITAFDAEAQVVFITGLANDMTRIQACEVGAADFVPKPIQGSQLKNAVRSAIDRRGILTCQLQPQT